MCNCISGCKFCRNSDCYSAPMKFKLGQRVRYLSAAKYTGVITHLDEDGRTYRVNWDNGINSWADEDRLELIDPVDYRELIQTEVNEIEAQILKLKERLELLTNAKNVLDELDKKV